MLFNGKDPISNIKAFEAYCKAAKRVIIMDAYPGYGGDLGAYIADLRNEQPFRIKSAYVPPQRTVEWMPTQTDFVDSVFEALRRGQCCAVICGTKSFMEKKLLKAIDKLDPANQERFDTMFYNSDKPMPPTAMANEEWAYKGKPRLLIYTATVRTGISYDSGKPFDRLFVAHSTKEDTPTMRDSWGQALHRCREFTCNTIVALETTGYVFGPTDEQQHFQPFIIPPQNVNPDVYSAAFWFCRELVPKPTPNFTTDMQIEQWRSTYSLERGNYPKFLQVRDQLGGAYERLLARCEIETWASTNKMDLNRLFRAQNLRPIVIPETDTQEKGKDDEQAWLLAEFAKTPDLKEGEYDQVVHALRDDWVNPPAVLGIKTSTQDDDAVFEGKSQFFRDRYAIEKRLADRKTMLGAKRKYEFCRDYPGLTPGLPQKLYDWLFATGQGRSSVYFTLQAIGKITTGVADVTSSLPAQHRIAEVVTKMQKRARKNQECADALRGLGVCVVDRAPHFTQGLRSYASPGVDCTRLVAVDGFEVGDFEGGNCPPEYNFAVVRKKIKRAGLSFVMSAQTRTRPKGPGQGGWQSFLKEFKALHPELSHKEAMKQASAARPKTKQPEKRQKTTYQIVVNDHGGGGEDTPTIEELGLILQPAARE